VTALLDETKLVAGATLSLAGNAVPGKRKKQTRTKGQANREIDFDENPLAE
jgi:hypothetical protein